MRYLSLFILCILLSLGVNAQIKSAHYRGAIVRTDAVPIYFNFEVKKQNGKNILVFENGSEKISVDELTQKDDSLFFQMPFYESSFKVKVSKSGVMEGEWIKWSYDSAVHLKFEAIPNIKKRFPLIEGKPLANISGKWDVTFYNDEGIGRKAVGTFQQNNSKLWGSFLTPTGDFRFLEGVVTGKTLKLSTFDGGLAYYFEAQVEGDSIKNGKFYLGGTRMDSWEAEKNPDIELDVSEVIPTILSAEPIDFKFKDLNGEEVRLSDKRFDDKVVVLQIMGSWCPNCMDETKFLSEIYEKYAAQNVEIIGLAYELSTDFDRSKHSLQRVIERFNVKYPVLITGVKSNDEEKTQKTIPQISPIKTFPTLLFLNKKKQIVNIHAGFAGPGTEGFYDQYVKEFKENLEMLLSGRMAIRPE